MNNKIEIEAECYAVGPVEEVGANGFKKRTFVLKERVGDAKYPSLVAFTLKKENVELVNESYRGRILKVTGFVESRSWEDPKTGKVRWFTDVTAVKAFPSQSAPAPEPAKPSADDFVLESEEMPF